jgi:hypothetical protein
MMSYYMDTLLLVLWVILICAFLFRKPEPFEDQPKIKPEDQDQPKIKPEDQDQPKIKPEDQDQPEDQRKIKIKPKPYLTKNHVTIQESQENPLMNCPGIYETTNRELQNQYQQISLNVYGYSKNPYIDMTRFVDFKEIQERLPMNPDFFK